MFSRLRLLAGALLATLLVSVGITATASAKPTLGFADNKPSVFDDQRLADLGVKQARMNLPWDINAEPAAIPNFLAWIAGAKKDHIAPLITLDRSRLAGKTGVNPSNAQITAVVKALHATYGINNFSAWNEGNINKKAKLVAGWYIAAKKGCPTCTILGADIVDKPNAVSWAKQEIAAVKKLHGKKISIFGIHNYVDVNNFTSSRTTAFVKAIKTNIWLTETGGVIARTTTAGSSHFKGTGTAFAAKATDYLLNKMTKVKGVGSRIKKIYLYSWSSAPNDIPGGGGNWDSGMIGPDGTERPALAVVRKFLNKTAVPGRPITPVPPSNVPFTPVD